MHEFATVLFYKVAHHPELALKLPAAIRHAWRHSKAYAIVHGHRITGGALFA